MLDEFLQQEVITLNNYVDKKVILPVKNKINYNINLDTPIQKKYNAIIEGEKLSFTKREVYCLLICYQNYTAKEIAKSLLISARTVETHISNVKKAGSKGKKN